MHEPPVNWNTDTSKRSKLPPEKLRSMLHQIYPDEVAEELFEHLTNPERKEAEDDSD